jgi:basic membrane lipoprotein Med (substrate-binding protein (PBP1-ABC) superfamily)
MTTQHRRRSDHAGPAHDTEQTLTAGHYAGTAGPVVLDDEHAFDAGIVSVATITRPRSALFISLGAIAVG